MMTWFRPAFIRQKIKTCSRQAVLVNTMEYIITCTSPTFPYTLPFMHMYKTGSSTCLYPLQQRDICDFTQVRRVCKYGSMSLPTYCVEIKPEVGAILLVNLALRL